MALDATELAKSIEANPLGRLMHGQRELFHSNLISWYFDTLPASADAVFRPLTGEGPDVARFVERERQHLDLVFHWRGASPLVIENKVFALPSLPQLGEYAGVASVWPGEPSLCLLAMSQPSTVSRFDHGVEARFTANGWRYLSYLELADRIEESLPPEPTYEVETMSRYVSLVRDIHQLVAGTAVESDDEPVWLTEQALAPIASSQMRGALRKARAQRVAHVIGRHISGADRPVGFALTNATPLVEWFGSARVEDQELWLGWQLQGVQFRRAVVFSSPDLTGRSAVTRDRREAFCRAHPELFAFPDMLGGLTQGRREFNHFAPSFVYRYVKTPELTIGELKAAAVRIQAEVGRLEHASDVPMDRAHISVIDSGA